MKQPNLACFLLFLAGVVLGLAQLWLKLWDPQTFCKIIITDGALFAVSLVWVFLVRDNKESAKINKGNSLD